MGTLGCRSANDYLVLLEENPQELARFGDLNVVTISHCFHDKQLRETLNGHIILKRSGNRDDPTHARTPAEVAGNRQSPSKLGQTTYAFDPNRPDRPEAFTAQ
jgi:hypothetical protein